MVKRDPQHQSLQKLRGVRSTLSIDLTKVVNKKIWKLIILFSEDKHVVALGKYKGTMLWYLRLLLNALLLDTEQVSLLKLRGRGRCAFKTVARWI